MDNNNSIEEENLPNGQDVYETDISNEDEFRKDLWQVKEQSENSFETNIMAISTGALGVSLTFFPPFFAIIVILKN